MSTALPALIQTEVRGLARDTHSKALISTDLPALQRARAARRKAAENSALRHQIVFLNTTCASLEARIDHLTQLLHATVAKLSG